MCSQHSQEIIVSKVSSGALYSFAGHATSTPGPGSKSKPINSQSSNQGASLPFTSNEPISKTLKKHFDIHVKYCDLVEKWTKDHDKFTQLWGEGSNLLSCIPGYSTHVEGNMLSPIVEWENLINK